MLSSSSGQAKTAAKEVCRRAAESNGDIRTSRCTPLSTQSVPKAYSPETNMVTLFSPASSPFRKSVTSTLKPRRSQNRWYMRKSISAQSWLSVPPAPALIDRMTFAASCSPPRVWPSSASSMLFCQSSTAAFNSPATASPAASHSWRTAASPSWLFTLRTSSRPPSIFFLLR